jgi:Uma2 family endonuclease
MAMTTNPTATNLMSWEAFEQLPDDGMHNEIIEGVLIALPPPKSRHSIIDSIVSKELFAIETRARCSAFGEAGYKLTHDPPTWIQPDVSFLSQARVNDTDPDGYFLGAPELAVEVILPSESANDVVAKAELMLEHRAQAVWVIYPKRRKVEVKLADRTSRMLGIDDKLTLPDLLPGWELPIAKLFE